MGRPQEPKPWHSGAIQLRAQGLTSKKISESLNVPEGTIKAFFSRSTPDRQRDILAHNNKIAPTPPPITPAVQQSLMEIMVTVERQRAETISDAMAAVKRYTTLSDDEAVENKGAKAKAYLAVEAIKALRTGADISITMDKLDPSMKQAGRDDEHTITIEVVDPVEAH